MRKGLGFLRHKKDKELRLGKCNIDPSVSVNCQQGPTRGYSGEVNSLLVYLLFQIAESFKGCMRGFYLNGKYVDIINSKAIMGVRPCFSMVEEGVHFDGFGYAIYCKYIPHLVRVNPDFTQFWLIVGLKKIVKLYFG